ncbi:hypothetical protein ABKV41_15890 [Enterobacter roggenkampii]|uniref:hypothetical protein n=1 Tax=Enterobacter roggenkampii TaxID=1812935 RepID=UPI001C70A426|nr:hypothetical protein [Enterobacter roggenkampii]MBW9416954.1 hypothetical protein [Enterobacter roggenkampii]
MPSAHCVCPEFIANHISDPLVFNNVFLGVLLQSDDQIITDSKGILSYEYSKAVENDPDAFSLYKVWQSQLDARTDGKLLKTETEVTSSYEEIIFDVVQKAATTFDKHIITSNNERYRPFISELTRQRISLYNLQNLTPSNIHKALSKKISFEELSHDIGWILHRLARTKSKGTTEDDFNDHLRNLFLFKHYEVKDQTREGVSSAGNSAGELDLVIEEKGFLFTIIEAMILESVDSSYIRTHYKKLLNNYNPLGVDKNFLITYYTGSRFEEWWRRYFNFIRDISTDVFELSGDISLTDTVEEATLYSSLKKLTQHFEINGRHACCVHYAVKF